MPKKLEEIEEELYAQNKAMRKLSLEKQAKKIGIDNYDADQTLARMASPNSSDATDPQEEIYAQNLAMRKMSLENKAKAQGQNDFNFSKLLGDMRKDNSKAIMQSKMIEMEDEQLNRAANAEATALSLGGTKQSPQEAPQNFTPEKRLAATSQVKQDLVKEVDKNPSLTNKEKNKVKKNLKDEKTIVRVMGKEQGDKPMSVADQFTNALTYFAPNIIGMAIGGLFEGSAGAIAGEEKAGALAGQYRKDKMAQEAHKAKLEDMRQDNITNARRVEMEAARLRQVGVKPSKQQQAKGFFEKGEDGSLMPLSYNPDSGQYWNPFTGKVVKLENIYSDAERRLLQSKELTGKQQEADAGFRSTLQGLAVIGELKASGINTGPMSGRLGKVGEKLGLASEEFTSLKAETENIKASFLKAMSGAQVSDREAARLAQIIPNIEDDDVAFDAKMRTFSNIVNRNKQAMLESIKTGQPLKAETVNAMLAEAEASNLMPGRNTYEGMGGPYRIDQSAVKAALERKRKNRSKGGK